MTISLMMTITPLKTIMDQYDDDDDYVETMTML